MAETAREIAERVYQGCEEEYLDGARGMKIVRGLCGVVEREIQAVRDEALEWAITELRKRIVLVALDRGARFLPNNRYDEEHSAGVLAALTAFDDAAAEIRKGEVKHG